MNPVFPITRLALLLRRLIRPCLWAGALWGGGVGFAAAEARPPLMPRPAVAHYTDRWLPLPEGLCFVVPPDAPARVREIAEVLCEEARAREGLAARIVPASDAAGAVLLRLVPGGTAADAEAYTLSINRTIAVEASDTRGLLWGGQTLLQSLERHADGLVLRCGTITDRPGRAWRALLLDPARSFLDLDFLRRTLRTMSAYKLNVLHLHLIDDQAWRFETRAFPRCNPHGEPCYTQEELRALVAYAARYGIEIVPEFDFPGHSRAAIAAYPALDCAGEVRTADDSLLCGGKAFTREFIAGIVAEAAAVFPSSYLHLGADEPFALKRWGECADCRRRMQELGVTSLESLYQSFVLDLNAIVRRHGKQLVVWNDAFHPGVKPAPTQDIIIDAWRDYANAANWAGAGHTLINSSTGPLYLTSWGLNEGLPLAAVQSWNATRFASPDPKRGDQTVRSEPLAAAARILGGQACAWATEQGLVERRLYPRLLAVAEALWAEGRTGDLADFTARWQPAQERRLQALGVRAEAALPEAVLFDGHGTTAWQIVGAPAFTATAEALASVGGSSPGWLRTRESFGDFILTFERWSPVASPETGVLWGCAPGQEPAAAPVGQSVSARPPPGFIPTGSLYPARQWNHYELVVRHRIVSLTINGRLAWSVAVPTPVSGALSLVPADGVQFRAIGLRRLIPAILP